MGLKSEPAAVIVEFDGSPVPLVEIPRPRWKIVVSILMGLLFVGYTALALAIPWSTCLPELGRGQEAGCLSPCS